MTTNTATQNGQPKLTDLQARFKELTGLEAIRDNAYGYLVSLYEKDASLKPIVDAIADNQVKFNENATWLEINSIVANTLSNNTEIEAEIDLDAIEDNSDDNDSDHSNTDDNNDSDHQIALNWFNQLPKISWQALGNMPFKTKLGDRLMLAIEGNYNKNAIYRHKINNSQLTVNFTYATGKVLLTLDCLDYVVLGELTKKEFTPSLDSKINHLLKQNVILQQNDVVKPYLKAIELIENKLLAANTLDAAIENKKKQVKNSKCMNDTEYQLLQAFKA